MYREEPSIPLLDSSSSDEESFLEQEEVGTPISAVRLVPPLGGGGITELRFAGLKLVVGNQRNTRLAILVLDAAMSSITPPGLFWRFCFGVGSSGAVNNKQGTN